MTPSASLDTLQSLPLGAVTLRAFNSRSRMQREAVNSDNSLPWDAVGIKAP